MEELDRQLGKLRKTHVGRSLPRDKDISTIKAQVSEILDSERKIAGSRKRNTGHERELLQKIENLENELKIVKGERDEAVELNKERIHELTATLLSVKTRINTFAERKEERERRIKELESKIKKT